MLCQTRKGFYLGYNVKVTKGDMKSENFIPRFNNNRDVSLNGHGLKSQKHISLGFITKPRVHIEY